MILLKTFSSLILALVMSLTITSQSVHGLSNEDALKMVKQVFDEMKQNSSFLDGSFDQKPGELYDMGPRYGPHHHGTYFMNHSSYYGSVSHEGRLGSGGPGSDRYGRINSIYGTKFHGWSDIKLGSDLNQFRPNSFDVWSYNDDVSKVTFLLELPPSKVTGTCSFGNKEARITLLSYEKTTFTVSLLVNRLYEEVILMEIESRPSKYFSKIDCPTDYDCKPLVEEVNGKGSYFHKKILGKIYHAFSNVMYQPSNTTFNQ